MSTAAALHRVDPGLGAEVRARIRDAGWIVGSLHRIYAPFDTDGAAEVLLIGHEMAASRRGDAWRPLTAWLPADAAGSVIVQDGW